MKNITPSMNLEKQVAKGCAAVDLALDETPPNIEKACYTTLLVAQMIERTLAGKPQPWSQFQPMIDEEFND